LHNRFKKHYEEQSRDRYLITYADLITLLLGLFVILYSSSQVDQEKYEKVKKALSKAFHKDNKGVLNGGQGVLNNKTNSPIAIAENDVINLEQIYQKTQNSLSDLIKDNSVEIRYNGDEIVLDLPENLLFESGQFEIKKSAYVVLDTITKTIFKFEKLISIDGHTDNAVINNKSLNGNWDLSVRRSLSVAQIMVKSGLLENNLIIRGFGEYRPKVINTNSKNMKKNRRVEISISEIPINLPSTKGYVKKEK